MLLSSIRNLIKSALYPLYERRLVTALDFSQTPHHVGVILDGNRRWAKANQLDPHDVEFQIQRAVTAQALKKSLSFWAGVMRQMFE